MNVITSVGMIAGLFTTIAFLPQVLKTHRSRSANDISIGMYLLFSLGLILWLVYGLAIKSWPVIIANSVTLILTSWMIGMKLYFTRQVTVDIPSNHRP